MCRFLVLMLALPCAAQAFELGLRAEAGPGGLVSQPQTNLIGAGIDLRATASLELLRFLDVELALGGQAFSVKPGSTYGRGPGFICAGAGARIKRPVASNLLIPSLSVDAQFSFSLATTFAVVPTLALQFRPSHSWPVLIGAFVRFGQHFGLVSLAERTSVPASVFSAGISLEYIGERRPTPEVASPLQVAPRAEAASDPKAATAVVIDTDGDSVPDGDDSCPRAAGTAQSDGCPAYKELTVTATRIELRQRLYFAFGTTRLLPRSFPLLDEVTRALADRPSVCVRVEGHSDAKGPEDTNLKLSEGRAAAVADYLAQQGIAASRLTSKGYGSTLPLNDNLTAEGREVNRRVEFMLVQCEIATP